jgi:hypothetical protein
MAEADVLELEWPPARLLDRLALRRLLERLAGVDPSRRNLPAPRVGDEAVAAQQEDAVLEVGDDDADRGMRQADDVVVEARAVG